MSRAGDKSRIARALREDAAEVVRADLDLWPMVREKVAAQRASTAAHAGAGTIMEHSTDRVQGTAREGGRRPILHLSLTAALPVLVLVVAMVGAYLAPAGGLAWLSGPRVQNDPCGLITQQEADAFVGAHLDQVQWEPVRPQSFACAYNGQNESLNLLVASFETEEQAGQYLKTRLQSISPSNARVMLLEEDLPKGAIEVPGVADEAYESTIRSQGNTPLYFRHIMARQGNTYFVVTWMTGKEEPSSELMRLAQRISERLRSW
ncbi:MAG TPA: hypothetical protein VFR15_12895 [Chloroflexia bacterium]|nr:hypothetical protein [Chloroflexia bacterium]